MRLARPSDREGTERLYLAAFPPGEASDVAALAVALLDDAATNTGFALVTEDETGLTGHIGFSPVGLRDEPAFPASILAPLAVHPAAQGQGIASGLIDAGLKRLREDGAALVFVYGDPAFYGRFGFAAASAEHYAAPYDLEYPFGWQAMKLPGHEALPAGGTLTCVAPLSRPELW